MKIIKRLLSIILVLALVCSSGLVEVIATAYRESTVSQPAGYTSVPVMDVSDMFVPETEPTTPAETEPATEAATEPAAAKPSVPVRSPATVGESNNFTYTVLDDNTCRIDGYTGELGEALVIPETLDGYPVTAIANYAFQNATTLVSVTLPDTVETIGGGAFQNCTSLVSFTVPKGLKEAGSSYNPVFHGCSALASVTVPEGVTALPAYIFADTKALRSVSLPSTLLTVGDGAFENSGITNIELPDSVTAIGSSAFNDCSTLTSIDVGTSLTSIGMYAFAGCSGLISIDLPNTVETIGSGAFQNCTSLASFTVPTGLKEAGSNYTPVFNGCSSLESVTVPEGITVLPSHIFADTKALRSVSLPSTLLTVGDGAFENSGITNIELPDSVTAIGSSAFNDCSTLTSIDVGTSLTSIGMYAFAGCSGLISIDLPNTVETIGGGAFQNCTSLASFTVPTGLKEAGSNYNPVFHGCSALTSVTVPEGVTALPATVFADTMVLKNVSLPSTLLTIGNSAFEGSSIATIELPDSVTTIGSSAFHSCTDLTSVDFGTGLTDIGNGAFAGCFGLISIDLPNTVETIGGGAFQNCTSLTSFTIPLGLTKAGSNYDSVFSGCFALASVTVPEGVTALPAYIFADTKALRSVSLPSTLLTVGNGAFANSSIAAIELPDSVTTIGNNVFENCTALATIDVGTSVTYIGMYAFAGCTNLTTVDLPNTVETIGYGAFASCTSLESVTLSDEITELPSSLFINCSSLRNVHTPLKLQRINSSAFENCTALTEIYIADTVTYIAYNAFAGIPSITFRCDLRSYATEFALDRQIPIIPTVTQKDEFISPLNTENSYYLHNYDGLSAAGVMSMVVHYEMQKDAAVTPTAVTVHIYDFASLQENTLTLDGELCTEYEYDGETGRLTVPVKKSSGTLRFCLKPLRYESLTSYARLVCRDSEGNESVAVIGAVNSLMPVLNINARQETASANVEVSGVAIPEADVSLYVDGKLTTSAKANKVGDYSAVVSLDTPENGREYVITAESSDRNGNVVVAQTKVLYHEAAPDLLDFVMIHGPARISLSEMKGTRPVISFRSYEDFRFEVNFTNPETLESVYVVSIRNNVKKYLQAHWNEELGLFVAEGFFDPNDHGYVPGALSVEYVVKGELRSFDQFVDFTSQEAYDALPDAWKNAETNVLESTDDNLKVEMTAGEGDEQISFQLSVTSSAIPFYITHHNARDYGYLPYTDDYGKTVYINQKESLQAEGSQKILLSMFDFGTGQVVDYHVGEFKDALGKALEIPDGFSVLTGLVDIGFTISDGISTNKDIKEIKEEYAKTPYVTATQIREFNELADQVSELNTSVTVLKCALTVLGVAGGLVFAPASAAGIAIAVGTTVVGLLADVMMQEAMCLLYGRAYGIDMNVKWAVDPSGYVYDRITNERIAGVTVHAYWIENTGEDPDFWANKPADDEYGVLWDSVEFSQMNPLITDAEGQYAWDVPEGWWRVSYEKEGYESVWSEWLPVPPPQTEVNIAMTPLDSGIAGDMNGDKEVNNDDVVLLLWFTLFPEEYLIVGNGDIDSNNTINNEDVVLLLWHTLFPEEYPLS